MRLDAIKKREMAEEDSDDEGAPSQTIVSGSQFGSSFGGGDKKNNEKGKGDDPAKFVPQEYHNPAYLEVLTDVFNARNIIGTKAKEKDKKKGGRGGGR
jgi:hypothetical protein